MVPQPGVLPRLVEQWRVPSTTWLTLRLDRLDYGRGEIRGRESRQQIEAVPHPQPTVERMTRGLSLAVSRHKGLGSPVRGCPSTFPELLANETRAVGEPQVRYAMSICAIAIPFFRTVSFCKMRDFQWRSRRLTRHLRNRLHIPETFFHVVQQNFPTRKRQPVSVIAHTCRLPDGFAKIRSVEAI